MMRWDTLALWELFDAAGVDVATMTVKLRPTPDVDRSPDLRRTADELTQYVFRLGRDLKRLATSEQRRGRA